MIYFVTGNAKKFTEMKRQISDLEQLDIDLPEIQSMDPHVIIKEKLKAALKHHSGPIIVEDQSLWFDCLNGFPGPLIKWLLDTVEKADIAKIPEPFGDFGVEAKAIIGYAKNPNDIHYFEGSVHGKLVQPRGDNGFSWDVIFQPDGDTRTFAEMTGEEKDQYSMRAKAAQKLNEFLKG